MPGRYCVVFNCKNHDGKMKQWRNEVCQIHNLKHADCPCLEPFKLFRFPKNAERRRSWLKNINRRNLTEPKYNASVCSLHFVLGRPQEPYPDPTLNLGYQIYAPPRCRLQGRTKNEAVQEKTASSTITSTTAKTQNDSLKAEAMSRVCTHVSTATQTDACLPRKSLGIQCKITTTLYDTMSDDDVRAYTGITMAVFDSILGTLMVHLNSPSHMDLKDQFLLVLMRLRLNLPLFDLGKRFNVSVPMVSKIFIHWIPILGNALKKYIAWLPKETIAEFMPKSFAAEHPNTTCIVECGEVPIQQPLLLQKGAATNCSYKRSTLKFLYAVSPSGFVMFVSKFWGGKTSDAHIIRQSGILDHLNKGDEVMTARRFAIQSDLKSLGVKLNMPALTRMKEQLTKEEATPTQRISSQWIHVEQAISRLKTFKILNDAMPVTLMRHANHILVTCAALCNFNQRTDFTCALDVLAKAISD